MQKSKDIVKIVHVTSVVQTVMLQEYFCVQRKRLGYVRNPRSLMEGTETLCRDDIGIYLEAPNISD